jgi:cytochrome b
VKNIDTTLRRVAVWDLPIRLFHWALAALIAFSWWSAEEGHLDWHMRSGLAVLTLLIFRVLWGIFGSSTARFANFVHGPRILMAYLRDMRGWDPVGHSPLGALSVLALLIALKIQVMTGLVQTDDDGLVEGPLAHLVSFDTAEAAHDLHEITFDLLVALIVLHVGAIVFYRIARGKKLVRPMITGSASFAAGTKPMRPGKWWVALLCLLGALAMTRWVLAGAPPFGP